MIHGNANPVFREQQVGGMKGSSVCMDSVRSDQTGEHTPVFLANEVRIEKKLLTVGVFCLQHGFRERGGSVSTSFPISGIRIRFAGETDIGKTHDHNEDTLYLPESIPLGIVADGMGGHASGEVASRMTVETMVKYFAETALGAPTVWPLRLDPLQANMHRMKNSISLSNIRLREQGEKDAACKNMGTTVVAIYFEDNYAIIAHIGDSRIYRHRPGMLELLMEDHSFVNDMARLKHISVEEAMASGTKTNVVSRVLGPNPDVFVDASVIYPRVGDLFLLCSDGLNDMLSDPKILEIIESEPDLDELAEKLVAAANDEGGEDNITVLLARVEKD